jgi:hypothetical protein
VVEAAVVEGAAEEEVEVEEVAAVAVEEEGRYWLKLWLRY